jgi:hypothetical protein
MLYIALTISCLLVVLPYAMAWPNGQVRLGAVNCVGAAGVLVGSCIMSPTAAVNALVLWFTGLACYFAKARPRTLLTCSLALTAAMYVYFGSLGIRLATDLRERYPFESIANRLTYETPRQAGGVVAREEADGGARLAEIEWKIGDGWPRTNALQALHTRQVAHFIVSPGFGIGRDFMPFDKVIDLRDGGPIPLPATVDPNSPPVGSASEALASRSTARLASDFPPHWTLPQLHETGVVDFVNARGFGYIVDREHVAGFQSHRFSALPELGRLAPEAARWRVEDLALVSLLKHEEPAVYLSAHLPRMDELRDAPIRPLDSFEQTTLANLRAGQDVAVRATSDRIRMLGAIRAVRQCVRCHEVERGELLGAFSYQLRRDAAGR